MTSSAHIPGGESTLAHSAAANPLGLSPLSVWSLLWAVYSAPHQGGICDSHCNSQHRVTFKPGCYLSPFCSSTGYLVSILLQAPWAEKCALWAALSLPQAHNPPASEGFCGPPTQLWVSQLQEGGMRAGFLEDQTFIWAQVQAINTMVAFNAKLLKLRWQQQKQK